MSLYHRWYKELRENKQQQEAFERSTHTVVIAGPGSGKTRVLAMKVAQLLRDEILPPQGVACLTYTRIMAKELENRLYSLGISERPNIVVGTVHSFCLGQVVQPFADLFELGLPQPLRIAPQNVLDSCLSEAWREVYEIDTSKLDSDSQFKRFRKKFTKYRRQRADMPFVAWKTQQEIGQAIQIYEQHLFSQGFVDFDVIVHKSLQLIINQDLVRQSLSAKFPWFAVDEYQDLGYPLFRIVTEMVNRTSIKLFAIGDPDQSIFDFAGTDPKYLIALSELPEMKPKIELERNYRSVQELVELSHVILGEPRNHYSQDHGGRCRVLECMQGTEQQAQVVVDLIQEYQKNGIRNSDIAVLHRRREGLHEIAAVMEGRVDYVLDKHRLYDRTMGIVRWLEDLGYWCLNGWTVQAGEANDSRTSFEDLLATWQQFGYSRKLGFRRDTNHARIHLARVLWNLSDPDQLLGDWLSVISKELDMDALLEQYRDIYPDEVDEFYSLRDMSLPGRELCDLQLNKFSNLSPSVQLTTLHSGKGTEFKVVIIAGVEQIENTANGRRLLYVGVTRAKRELCLLYTKAHPPWFSNSSLPQYISELTNAFKHKHWAYFTHERC
jgi:DNA helicase-2/ATP-dependent DNA helicase PcrA